MLDRVNGRIAALVLAVLAVGVLVAFVGQGSGPSDPPAAAGPPVPPGTRVPVPVPLPAADITGVDAPTIGLSTRETTDLGLGPDDALEVPRDAETVGWYDGGVSPGEVGPAVLAAHVNYRGEQGAFIHIGRMKAGDAVEVHRDDDTTAVFTVDRVEQVAKAAFPTEAVYAPTPDGELRMITCGGEFDGGAGSYVDNVVVFAHLTSAYRTA
ncbi:hypothetical protein Acsp06_23740 [Actinomycetospora sp. NBRC 106375]|uniref:class F sortase n=1 Tax=Actinomycetospora sp. NBRC 106375 TaxID=3032207 RepID=UPI0024A1591E|nr:class F sortase [Actinomycetospora sp. NBRC 106375]GLZ46189.1 hypothetical protein Acsp06_23740 [Actinomycetospora sp. NBRC 106375]